MSEQYDDTNSGVFFTPHPDQRFVGSGKLNIEGNERRLTVIHEKLKADGEPVMVVYARIGILFPDDTETENSPNFSGPIDNSNLRIAGWSGEKDGRRYCSLKLSERRSANQAADGYDQPDNNAIDSLENDDIPF